MIQTGENEKQAVVFGIWVLGHWGLFRISDFVLRI